MGCSVFEFALVARGAVHAERLALTARRPTVPFRVLQIRNKTAMRCNAWLGDSGKTLEMK
jgi:hypothetical protein